jgi:hypothetical protein
MPDFCMIIPSIFHRTLSLNATNILNHPTSRSLYGVVFAKGGMNTFLRKVVREVRLSRSESPNRVHFATYADNLFIWWDHGGETCWASLDGLKMEATARKKDFTWQVRYKLERGFEGRFSDHALKSSRIGPSAAKYMHDVYPELCVDNPMVVHSTMMKNVGFATGIQGTFQSNQWKLSNTLYWLIKDPPLPDELNHLEGPVTEGKIAEAARLSGIILKCELRSGGTSELPSLEQCKTNPLSLESWGLTLNLDLLGWDAKYLKLKVGDNLIWKGWIPLLSYERALKALCFSKAAVRRIFEDLSDAAKLILRLATYNALYVWLWGYEDLSEACRAVCLELMREMKSISISPLDTAVVQTTTLASLLHSLEINTNEDELGLSLQHQMVDTFLPGLPTIYNVLKVTANEGVAHSFARHVMHDEQLARKADKLIPPGVLISLDDDETGHLVPKSVMERAMDFREVQLTAKITITDEAKRKATDMGEPDITDGPQRTTHLEPTTKRFKKGTQDDDTWSRLYVGQSKERALQDPATTSKLTQQAGARLQNLANRQTTLSHSPPTGRERDAFYRLRPEDRRISAAAWALSKKYGLNYHLVTTRFRRELTGLLESGALTIDS